MNFEGNNVFLHPEQFLVINNSFYRLGFPFRNNSFHILQYRFLQSGLKFTRYCPSFPAIIR